MKAALFDLPVCQSLMRVVAESSRRSVEIVVSFISTTARDYWSAFTVGDQLLWGVAEPLRRMLRILT
jgi:aspartate-semialdehyde dehydrogenase